MFFLDQAVMGFNSLPIISETKGEMNVEKQNCSMSKQSTADRETFLNFLFQVSELKIPDKSGIEQEKEQLPDGQTKKEPLNIFATPSQSKFINHSLKMSVIGDISDSSEYADNKSGDADDPELDLMISENPEKLGYKKEVPYIESFLSKKSNSRIENKASDHFEGVSKDAFISHDIENKTRDISNVENGNKKDPGNFLNQVLLSLKNAHEVPRTEVDFSAASIFKLFESKSGVMQQTQEPLINPRQFFDLIKQSKNIHVVENENSDEILRVFAEKDIKLENAQTLVKNIAFNSSMTLQTTKETVHPISNQVIQFVPALDNNVFANHLKFPIRSAVSIFDNDPNNVDRNILGQMVIRLYTGLRQGSQNMTIHLYPPELGKIKVKIISDKGDLNVRLHSINHQVAGILEKYLPLLQQSLEDQGIVLADLQVSVESGDKETSQFEQPRFSSANSKLTDSELFEENNGKNHDWFESSHWLNLRV
jgi:hypothetical protein